MNNTIKLNNEQRMFLSRICNESLFYNDYEIIKRTLKDGFYHKEDRKFLTSVSKMFAEEIRILT